MYTEEDYVRDLYIKEHGDSYARFEAEARCRAYENGRDPEYELSEAAIKERHKRNEQSRRKYAIPLIISFLITVFALFNTYVGLFCVAGLIFAFCLLFGRYI